MATRPTVEEILELIPPPGEGGGGRPGGLDRSVECRVASDPLEVRDAQDLRVRVFCGEQGVPREAELDGLDAEAIHLVALDGDRVIGTCRLQYVPSGFRLGRMAVHIDRRRAGVGSALLAAAETEAARWDAREMVLHAQRAAQKFYAGAGYAAVGGSFLEEGIEHVRMCRELTGPGT